MNGTQNSIMLEVLEASTRMGLKPTINEIFEISQWIEGGEQFSQVELKKLRLMTYELSKQALEDIKPTWM